MTQPELQSCTRCGRARPAAQAACACGQTESVPAVEGGLYDAVMGVFADPSRHERAVAMERGMELSLLREPDNTFDANAIAVLDTEGGKLGYVPKETAAWLAPRIDAGETWAGRLTRVFGRTSRSARIVMFLHRPDVAMPETDVWQSLPDEILPRISSSRAEQKLILRGGNGAGDSNLCAYLDEAGRLHIDGQDFGSGTSSMSLDGEYEYFKIFAAEDIPRVIAALDGEPGEPVLGVLRRWSGDRSYEMERRLREADIPHQFFSC